MTETTTKRDDLRAKTLGDSPKFRHKIIEYKGERYEMRQPTVRARSEIIRRAMYGNDGNAVDMLAAMVWAVIFNTYVPGTDTQVFADTDYDALMAKPTGGFIDTFGEVATGLMDVDSEIKKNNLSKA